MAIDQGYTKRRFQRIETQLKARVAASGVRYDGRILNVSTGGCLIEGPIRARVGQVFAVGYPKNSTWEIFRCKILWSTARGDAFQFGNGFLVMDEKAKHILMLNLIEAAGVELP